MSLRTFIASLLVLSFASCSVEDIGDCSTERPEQACDAITGKLYTGSGKIYMALSGSSETMLEIGSMSNGKVTLALPENVDSHFLRSWNEAEPSDVEIGSYTQPLRLFSNSGKLIGGLTLEGTETDKEKYFKIHRIFYWYFSKDAEIKYPPYYFGDICVYDIDAKEGWNKIYVYMDYLIGDYGEAIGNGICYKTDLSEVPGDLMWWVIPESRL